ncbi:hypothetical protein EV702DRAFT_970293, partial [Suillus placidus]
NSYVREALRLRAPVTWTMRIATKDDQISVAKPFLDQSGESRDSIKIRKHYHHTYPGHQMGGRCLLLQVRSLTGLNVERWQNPPEQVKEIQGLYSDVLTFLSGSHG